MSACIPDTASSRPLATPPSTLACSGTWRVLVSPSCRRTPPKVPGGGTGRWAHRPSSWVGPGGRGGAAAAAASPPAGTPAATSSTRAPTTLTSAARAAAALSASHTSLAVGRPSAVEPQHRGSRRRARSAAGAQPCSASASACASGLSPCHTRLFSASGSTSSQCAPCHARRSASTSHAMMPSAKTSDVAPRRAPPPTSGQIYPAVPATP